MDRNGGDDALAGVEFEEARSAISRVHALTVQSLKLYEDFFDDSTCWPYQLNDRTEVDPSRTLSASTTSMILHACAVSAGAIRNSVLVPAIRTWRAVPASPTLESNSARASRLLFGLCASGKSVTTSKTWGDDDPLTLAWLYELLTETEPDSDLLKRVANTANRRLRDMLEKPNEPVLRGGDIQGRAVALSHCLPVLRLLQVRSALLRDGRLTKSRTSVEAVTEWLLTRLHTHLSLSEIANSDFDPAELIFALEGLLLVQNERIAESLVERTLSVMHSSARVGTYWRPVRPLRIDSQGSILLPQSVEVANSLLRICDLLGGVSRAGGWLSPTIRALGNYTEWLESTVIRGYTSDGRAFQGWQSDHTHTEGCVHLWATSQALLYCQHYGALLQQYLARSLQRETGIIATSNAHVGERDAATTWAEVADKEPLSGLPQGSTSRVYDRVSLRFIHPRLRGDSSPPSSMLLYGPPGTGKTSFAEDLAAVLGYELITVTPSDFIRAGEAGVEARARRVFEMLYEQSNAVVLFDEIDRLILARDSPAYGSQSDMFQFMTPSMLTKLNNLRRANRVLSIIATNYEDMIDSAVKRSGRIDDSLLLLPPDKVQRGKIVRRQLEKVRGPGARRLSDNSIMKIVDATPLFAYQELRYVCETAVSAVAPSSIVKRVARAVDEFRPAISLNAYRGRFRTDDSDIARDNVVDCGAGPVREVVYLAYLVAETGTDPLSAAPWLKAVIRRGIDDGYADDQVKAVLESIM